MDYFVPNSNPVTLVIGIEGMDEEQLALSGSDKFWKIITERRAQRTLTRAELEGVTMALPFDLDKLIEICRQNDVAKIGIFGSVARGEFTDQSDIDLLVYFSKRKSLLALVSLERQLTTALGRKVDLLTEAAISPYLRSQILSQVQVIYEATR
ncbi:MAG: nucleotidyltransferase family protein [Anaerolineae bacterium]|nr:nucleotidyltransferase family protein [Anaerolineae bacterium]